jgi:hypothetical protein
MRNTKNENRHCKAKNNNLKIYWKCNVTHSQLFEGLKCESQTEDNGRARSRGTLLGS